MKPKILHQQAMDFSFKAKQALEESNYDTAFELYKLAADLESQVAEFYFDKPELEPTRSIVIRSAAFMNLKAGLLDNAQRFIFYGLLHSKDALIKSQLSNALEMSISLKNSSQELASQEYNYLNILRQRSVDYVIEPANLIFGHSISLEMFRDFTDGYLKSLKAYAKSKFRKIQELQNDIEENLAKEFEKLINPLITNSAYGSLKISISNDFLARDGESKKLVELKSNIVSKFHNEIFINPLSDTDISKIKQDYDEEEVNEIFRPLTKIKSNNTPYKVGYYDSENFSKIFVDKIVNKQRKQLLSVQSISQEDIGELENSIIHKRSSLDGKVSKKTILREQLKSYEFDKRTSQIMPQDFSPLILSEEILLTVKFNSENGFHFSFDDFRIEYIDIEFEKGLIGFYSLFYNKILYLVNTKEKNDNELKDWEIVKKLIANPDSLKK